MNQANPQVSCLSIDCPERKSVCCDAISKAYYNSPSTIEGVLQFVCSACLKPFVGGKCDAQESTWQDELDSISLDDFFGLKEFIQKVEKQAEERGYKRALENQPHPSELRDLLAEAAELGRKAQRESDAKVAESFYNKPVPIHKNAAIIAPPPICEAIASAIRNNV